MYARRLLQQSPRVIVIQGDNGEKKKTQYQIFWKKKKN